MNLNRSIAMLVAAITMVSSFGEVTAGALSYERAADSPETVSSDYSVKSTNALADYLMGAAKEEQEKSTTAAKNTDSVFQHAILGVEFDRETGKLTLQSSQNRESTAIITFSDDASKKEVFTSEIQVPVGENIYTDTTISSVELPEFFIVSVQLVDVTKKPLCEPFPFNKYCKEMQEILATDIHDFEPEKVVNFDVSEDTNFVVLSDDTIIAESSENENVLVSADYDAGVYVFDSADDTINSLENGELFYIQPTAEDVIALSVESVEVNGDQTTIKGNSEEIDDMFEFIKFETTADTKDAVVSESDEYVDCSYVEDEENPDGALVCDSDDLADKILNALPAAAPGTVGASFEVNLSKEFEPKEGISVTPSVSLGFDLQFDYYKKWSYIDVICKLETPFTVSITLAIGTELGDILEGSKYEAFALPFAYIDIPTGIPGLYINIEPTLCVELSGEFSVSYSATPTFGFTYNSDEGLAPIENKGINSSTITVKAEGKIFIGISLNQTLTR